MELCLHSVAVVQTNGKLEEFCDSYRKLPSITQQHALSLQQLAHC